MSRDRGRERALHNLGAWTVRPAWEPIWAEVLAEHLAASCALLEVEAEEIIGLLRRQGELGQLASLCLLDLASRPPCPGRPNLVEDYLAHRGWRERPATRRWLALLGESAIGLYEVEDCVAPDGLVLHDLLREGDVLRVGAAPASRELAPGDVIATRVLGEGRTATLADGYLPLLPGSVELVRELLRAAHPASGGEPGAGSPAAPRRSGPAWEEGWSGGRAFDGNAAPFITAAWVAELDCLVAALAPPGSPFPGGVLEAGEIRFPVPPGARSRVEALLDRAPDWERDRWSPEPRWCWETEVETEALFPRTRVTGIETGRVREPRLPDRMTMLCHASLEEQELVLASPAPPPMARAVARLRELAGDLLGPPTTEGHGAGQGEALPADGGTQGRVPVGQ